MATAKSLSEREQILHLFSLNHTMVDISQELKISYSSIKSLIKRHKTEGIKGLVPHYERCGRKRTNDSERSYRLVRLYKRFHPQWGVGYILMKIKEKYPHLPLLVSRVYERRLKSDNCLTLPKNPPLQAVYHPESSRLPHDTWQVDAKERLKTLDNSDACYLTISDEKSGCVLETKVFSPQSD